MAFTKQNFLRQKRQAINYIFQGLLSLAVYPFIWHSIHLNVLWVDILVGFICACAAMLTGTGLLMYRSACIRRALSEFPDHPLWYHETFNTIMYRPDYLMTWTWKQWEKAMKESQ